MQNGNKSIEIGGLLVKAKPKDNGYICGERYMLPTQFFILFERLGEWIISL